MLNFRKLKQDFSSHVIKEGKTLFEKNGVDSAHILALDNSSLRLQYKVLGNFEHSYDGEIEIDRQESTLIDSCCACNKSDCQHLVAVILYLEKNFDEIVVTFSKKNDIEHSERLDEEEKKRLRDAFKEAETKEVARKGKKYQKELLHEYIRAAEVLAQSPFFLHEDEAVDDKAEIMVIFNAVTTKGSEGPRWFEIQLALRLPFRSKPYQITNLKEFLSSVRYREPLFIGHKRYLFGYNSFDIYGSEILKMIMDQSRFLDTKDSDKNLRIAHIDAETFGSILAHMHSLALSKPSKPLTRNHDLEEEGHPFLPCLYSGNGETPLRYSNSAASVRFDIECLGTSFPKILLTPHLIIDNGNILTLEEACIFECARPGLIYQNTYYRFQSKIKRKHVRHLPVIRNSAIPEPLFGTFIENSMPELLNLAQVGNKDILERFVTFPFVGKLEALCDIHYLNSELEVTLSFIYDNIKVPANTSQLLVENITAFVTEHGILARNLTEEKSIIEDLFQGFFFDESQGLYSAKSDKKIIEFMTEVIPRNQHRVQFNCPENLLEQFIYDDTHFKLHLKETPRVHLYEVDLKVMGHLNGITVDQLWDCLSSKRSYIELNRKKEGAKKSSSDEVTVSKMHKILVLDLEKLRPIVQIFDELGITHLDDHTEARPLWSLASISPQHFDNLPIEFSMSQTLHEIQQQMLGNKPWEPTKFPDDVKATLRKYQSEGVDWLHRLRSMHLNGILADDMGLGKTLQAIVAITQHKIEHPHAISIVVCPTSLVYNWKEEFNKFNSKLRILPVDGSPAQRARLFGEIKNFDIIITSYNLLQKDIEFYKTINFAYAILDEAQHIKNRNTRNAKSVKMLVAAHRLILTGTPIENSLEELWSLFDFLMPGLLSSFERFVEKFIRSPHQVSHGTHGSHLETLRYKVSPFILRRMKKEVLSDLPPVSEILYHCHLTDTQRELYRSYANSAREELVQLVKKEGFDNVQIHVLATLTRLKQICCHPAIFAKEKPENGDSAKYDMLIELIHSLLEGKHKTVIFSQYTRMLNIIRHDLEQMGIRIAYLDGSSKNRMSIVKQFNEDENVSIFLVSLKAGGSGLNLVSADTVIHYDMWWNPAVENQATDRVHRIGQKSSVSSYKLVTLGTIEEKILELQKRKQGLVKQIISSDDEALTKLTWEEVLELLET